VSDREAFIANRQGRWSRLDHLLKTGINGAQKWSELARLYRSVAADLSRARSLDLPPDIVRYLEQLSANAHNRLYGSQRSGGGRNILRAVMVDFPVELRRQWRFFLLASLLFYGPFAIGALGALVDPAFASAVLPEATLANMEQMYSGDTVSRQAGEDAMMAGFYVMNNVGIALRCFATGAFLGLGSVYTLVYNGLVMGVIEGYLWSVGAGWNLLDFTAGHTAWELTGVVVAGTAGLKLGWSIVVTNGRTRAGSLKAAGPALFRLIIGATALLFGAAAIEAFWSASPVPLMGKLIFGAFQVLLVGAWLSLGGIRADDS
jgi:uncharacterized membrane protein SpoIIM required for sporulation